MPMPFDCPHGKCIYCPGGIEDNTPLSYVGTEPVTKIAQHVNYYVPFQGKFGQKLIQLIEGAITSTKTRIVLMSDGGQTVRAARAPRTSRAGRSPRRGRPPRCTCRSRRSPSAPTTARSSWTRTSRRCRSRSDDEAMRRIAELSKGQFFTAASETELRQVYAQLGEQIGYEMRKVDTSRPWLAGGALMLFVGRRRGHRAGPAGCRRVRA